MYTCYKPLINTNFDLKSLKAESLKSDEFALKILLLVLNPGSRFKGTIECSKNSSNNGNWQVIGKTLLGLPLFCIYSLFHNQTKKVQ